MFFYKSQNKLIHYHNKKGHNKKQNSTFDAVVTQNKLNYHLICIKIVHDQLVYFAQLKRAIKLHAPN